VQKFGDFSFMTDPIGDFEGVLNTTELSFAERMLKKANVFFQKKTPAKREF